MSESKIEEISALKPKFNSDGLIPAVAMDFKTKEPLMLAYMNAESLQKTLEIKQAVYYSRSRQEIWHKGATSGQYQKIHSMRIDCDQDALIIYVEQLGAGACHTGRSGCFYREIDLDDTTQLNFSE